MANALGIDTAGCNGRTYWDIAKEHGIVFGAARATISWGYQDKWFPDNWKMMKEQGIHRFAYHVLYPDQTAKAQVDNFLRCVGEDWTDAFPVLDAELTRGMTTKSVITNVFLSWLDGVKKYAPKPLIYSRKQWIDDYTYAGSWRHEYDWWLAQYLNDRWIEAPPPPALPTGAQDWLVHQNADHFPAWPGLTPDSHDLDIDRWNGDEAAVDAYFGAPQPPVTIEQRVDRIEAWITSHGGW